MASISAIGLLGGGMFDGRFVGPGDRLSCLGIENRFFDLGVDLQHRGDVQRRRFR
jgi:hypothetical protein